jgi:hypothetical protein
MRRASAIPRSVLFAFAAAAMAACGAPAPTAVPSLPVPATSVIAAPSAPPSSTDRPLPATLKLSATGLGPCRQPWWSPCIYGIRVEAPNGYDHRGSFTWDSGPPPSGEMGMGTAGPVWSTGVVGDVPATLAAGTWTVSFRLYYGSDDVSMHPVPGGTPRNAEEDPFTAACSTDVTVTTLDTADVKVAFKGAACKVRVTISGMPMPWSPAAT